ncbi:MAG: SDR family oxidoreductase [Negativicutes bacterium]|nr:SDR family oxidoreductase [Negativicutes bacterium]
MAKPADLSGKVVLVTGGSRGIGREICRYVAAGGAQVAFTFQSNIQQAEITRAMIETTGGTCLGVYQMDVRDRTAIDRVVAAVAGQAGGCLHGLVNNAGINKPCDFDQITGEDWDEILAVNLKGPFLVSQAALPYMKGQGGSIVNIGSVSGQYGGPRTAHYAASKAGLISLSQVIARFAARYGIRCNTVAAGLIASEMADAGLASPAVSQAAENILLRRLGSGREVAAAVAFLLSDEAGYITAQTINVNGGLYF